MRRVTRDIDPASAQDLLKRVPRACLSFAGDQGPEALPVRLFWQEGRYLVNIKAEDKEPLPGQEAVLLVDEGIYYFQLRAIYIRGNIQPTEPPQGTPADRTWYELIPTKTVAWDYGAMREVDRP